MEREFMVCEVCGRVIWKEDGPVCVCCRSAEEAANYYVDPFEEPVKQPKAKVETKDEETDAS